MAETPEATKAKRGVVKGQLTKTMTSLNRLMLEEEVESVRAKAKALEDLMCEFEKVCEKHKSFLAESPSEMEKANAYHVTVKEEVAGFQRHVVSWLATIDDDEMTQSEDEADEVEKLRREFDIMKAKRTPIKKKSLAPSSSTPMLRTNIRQPDLDESQGVAALLSMSASIQHQSTRMMDAMKRPNTKFKVFNGEPLEFYPFIRSFESVMSECDDPGVKLNTLYHYAAPAVQNSLQSCLLMEPEAGFKRAWSILHTRYGDKDRITQAWVNKVLDRPAITTDISEMRNFVDDLTACVETLKTLGCDSELDNSRTLLEIVKKTPQFVQSKWLTENNKIKESKGRKAKLADMIRFLERVTDTVTDPSFGALSLPDKGQKEPRRGAVFYSSGTSREESQGPTSLQCHMCGGQHFLVRCDRFKALKVIDRLSFIKTKRLCINCLSNKHFANECTSKFKCRVCSGKHHTFLHIERSNESFVAQPANTHPARPESTERSNEGFVAQPANTYPARPENSEEVYEDRPNFMVTKRKKAITSKKFLPIIPIRVTNDEESLVVETYALFDRCGTDTYCDKDLQDKLKLVSNRTGCYGLTTLNGKSSPFTSPIVSLRVSSVDGALNSPEVEIGEVNVLDALNISTDFIPTQDDVDKWDHLRGTVRLPKPSHRVNKVQMLIGLNAADLLVPLDLVRGKEGKNEPFAMLLPFGWTVSGADPTIGDSCSYFIQKNYVQENSADDKRMFSKMWALDSEYDEKQVAKTDDRVLQIYDESLKKREGRICLKIPFKDGEETKMANNRVLAEYRLKALGKRLEKNEELRTNYCKAMNDLVENKFAEPANTRAPVGRENYLPHHPAIHPRKKMRPVFGCDALFRGESLNSKVHKCPNLANDLGGVFIRFREGPIAIKGDIKAMFHQVLVEEDQRDFLRYLWWKNNEIGGEVEVFRMRAHLFGGSWSPSAAIYALRKLADNPEFSERARTSVKNNFYVDDWLKAILEFTKAKCEEEAIALIHELRKLLWRGGMHLCQFASNSKEVLNSLPETELAKGLTSLNLDYDDLPTERTLGVLWDCSTDSFKFSKFDLQENELPKTRRGILSLISQIYDPQGFIIPYVVPAKCLLQLICRKGYGWDDGVSYEIFDQWQRWFADLQIITKLEIPRCVVIPYLEISSVGLHIFCDASEKSYGSVAYIRVVHTDGRIKVSLLKANNRLAPLRGSTIPRLELAAAAEAAKMSTYLRENLSITPTEPPSLWSDSMITLWYIQSPDSKRFQLYVANRLNIIAEHSEVNQWKYVPTAQNVADEASRGCTAKQLVENERWVRGPAFLYEKEEGWPRQPVFKCTELEEIAEIKKEKPVYMTLQNQSPVQKLIEHYSSWYKLKKAVAYLIRYKEFMRCKIPLKEKKKDEKFKKPLTVVEIQSAEVSIIRFVQKEQLSNRLSDLKNLNPIKTEQSDILCVGGRIEYANVLPMRTRHPWILPDKHHVTRLIVGEYHRLVGHGGVERVLTELRKKFWVLKGRAFVKNVILPCVTCKRRSPQACKQLMSPLPSVRILPDESPFNTVGVDYFGPFLIKRGRSEHKRYVCLFTCMKIRAVHLELSWTLDADSFIQALQRFTARRGEPREIYSDNGTNLTGAEAELRRALQELIKKEDTIRNDLRKKNIEWKFGTPRASWMGGVWERQIRTTRSVLKAVIGLQTLDEEGLITFLAIAEGIINGRPITKLSEDPRDMNPLTPNHLLLLKSGPTSPPGLFVQRDLYKRRWRQVQYMADVFWKRWVAEYIPSLQERQKWMTKKSNLKGGDLVLLTDELNIRGKWPLGLIEKAYPSTDGLIRSVKVKTESGSYDRPVGKLCLLEAQVDDLQ